MPYLIPPRTPLTPDHVEQGASTTSWHSIRAAGTTSPAARRPLQSWPAYCCGSPRTSSTPSRESWATGSLTRTPSPRTRPGASCCPPCGTGRATPPPRPCWASPAASSASSRTSSRPRRPRRHPRRPGDHARRTPGVGPRRAVHDRAPVATPEAHRCGGRAGVVRTGGCAVPRPPMSSTPLGGLHSVEWSPPHRDAPPHRVRAIGSAQWPASRPRCGPGCCGRGAASAS